MKKLIFRIIPLLLFGTIISLNGFSQNSEDREHMQDSKEAQAEFVKGDSLMQALFDNSYGYVIFPNIGKGAIGIGGAAGNGIVYEKEHRLEVQN